MYSLLLHSAESADGAGSQGPNQPLPFPDSASLPGLTLAGMLVFLECVAWVAGAEVAANVVVAQVLAAGLGSIVHRAGRLRSAFVEVWKGVREGRLAHASEA